MNISLIRMALLGAGMSLALILSGCQSTGGHSAATADDTTAVMCPKCETTWVRVPQRGRAAGKIITYRSKEKMTCPDCESAVRTFFTTGELAHRCETCGDGLRKCEVH